MFFSTLYKENKMKALIIEDEMPASDRLLRMLKEVDYPIEVVEQLDTIERSITYLKNNEQPDLIFLDIELGDGQSFDIFKRIPVKSYIIFITAFDEFTLKAFKLNSIDYLLKPLKKNELEFALEKFSNQHTVGQQPVDFLPLVEGLKVKEPAYKNRILVKKGTRLLSVKVESIAFFYTRNRVHWLKTIDDTDYIIENNLDELESQLDPEKFHRVNRQFIINYDSIDKVNLWFDGKIKLIVKPSSPEEIIISRLRANEFKKWLG